MSKAALTADRLAWLSRVRRPRDADRAANPQSEPVLRSRLKDINSFLFSAVCHLLVLLALGFLTVAANRDWQGIELLASLSPGYDGPTGEELAPQETVQFEVTQDETSSAVGPPKPFEFSAVAASELPTLDPLLNMSTSASGLNGQGVGNLGDALGAPPSYATDFFGIGGSGQSFVYVVDCSKSMNEEGKFTRARYELIRSIEQLTPDQRYFVIFYNEGAYPMDADSPVPVTPEQVERMRRWVNMIEPGGGTNPLPALLMALKLKPDAIFFLSDGLFDPSTIQSVRRANRAHGGRIPIHTISFVNYESQGLMRLIARQAGGEFRFVP
jgi:von Willebrand factor type A domain